MNSIYIFCVLLITCCMVLEVNSALYDCSQKLGELHYDLTKLTNAMKKDILFNQADYNYYYRPCQVPAGCAQTPTKNAAICQVSTSTDPKSYNLGQLNTTKWGALANGLGFWLNVTGGDRAVTPPLQRSAAIQFVCDPTQKDINSGFSYIREDAGTLVYYFTWTISYACPVKPGGGGGKDDDPAISGGWIFIIILFSLSFLYFVGGVAYQKFKNHATGLELIPNVHFWISLPGLVKDGNLYLYRKCRSLCGGGERYEVV